MSGDRLGDPRELVKGYNKKFRTKHRTWRELLAVEYAKLELQVTMGEIKTTLHHLNNLQEGELLFFKKDDTALMSAHEVPTFHVNVGTRGSQVAVQIDHEHIHGKL